MKMQFFIKNREMMKIHFWMKLWMLTIFLKKEVYLKELSDKVSLHIQNIYKRLKLFH